MLRPYCEICERTIKTDCWDNHIASRIHNRKANNTFGWRIYDNKYNKRMELRNDRQGFKYVRGYTIRTKEQATALLNEILQGIAEGGIQPVRENFIINDHF